MKRVVSLFVVLVVCVALPAQAQTPSAPIAVERSSFGQLQVEVDFTPCLNGPSQCAGYRPDPAGQGNDQPVRLVIQLATLTPLENLKRDDFDLQVAFPPLEGAGVRLLDCPDCFEAVGGGTYALWVVPDPDVWAGGTYYVRLGLTGQRPVLPTLVRFDFTGPPVINKPPTAAIVALPPGGQILGRSVIFDGSASIDPDGDLLTCFQWSIDSSIDEYDEVIQGVAISAFERTYPEEMTLDVILRVSDDPSLPADCLPGAAPIDPNRLSPNLAVIAGYVISCGNLPPVANAGADKVGPPGPFLLDGTLSFDNDGTIQRYVWDCGAPFPPLPITPDGSRVQCVYQVPGTYVATLTVIDDGTGVPDPRPGAVFQCEKSDTDEVNVEVVIP